MNERIKELAEQAGMKPCADMSKFGMNEDMNPYNCQEFMLEKFAELLAQDAISVVQSFRCKMDASNDNIVEALKQHFGVE